MPIQTRLESGVAVVTVSGRLVLGREVEQLETAVDGLLKQGQKTLVLDFSKLDYTDSSGIGTVVSCLTKVKKAGGDIRMAGPNPRIRRILQMTGVDTMMSVYATLAEAVAG